jgi:RHS repeat-associated protein
MRFITKLSLATIGILSVVNAFASDTWTADYSASGGNSVKTVTSPNGTSTYSYRQGFGEPILLDNTRGEISSTGDYDDVGRLLSLSQGGESRSYNYTDGTHLNWLISQDDPELGSTNYTYYPNGARKTEQVAGGSTTSFTYDANSNIATMTYSASNGIPASPTLTYGYDANNNVTSKSLGSTNQIANTYDVLNHLLTTKLSYDAITQNGITYTYDDYGHMATMTYPDGLSLNYNPDALGRSQSIASSTGSIIAGITYNPANKITAYTGTSFSLATTYDDMNRIGNIKTTSANRTYSYDGENNITGIADNKVPANNEVFGYDNLNRLTSSTGIWGNSAYAYDDVNNITSLANAKETNTYAYDSKNLLSSVTSSTKGAQSLAYDANGNIIQKGDNTYVYDAANHLISFKNKDHSINFVYDPNGHVISTTQDAQKPVITYYDESGKLIYKLDPNQATNQVTDYIYLEDKLAVQVTHNEGDLTSATYHYITTNALGSPIASTLNGATEWTQIYRPYGIEQTEKDANHIGFTGKETIKDMNLVNMNARYYSPDFGRFMAYDPAEPKVDDLFSFNRYSYANDNPLLYTDPTGLFSWHDFFHGANNFASGIFGGGSGGLMNTSHESGLAYDAGWALGTAATAFSPLGAERAAAKVGGLIESSMTKAVTETNVAGQTSLTKDIVKYYPDNNGFIGEIESQFLYKGTKINRYGGSDWSKFFSPQGTPNAARSLPANTINEPLRTFEVMKPFSVMSGKVAPAYGQVGGGTQLISPVRLKTLLSRGVLREL